LWSSANLYFIALCENAKLKWRKKNSFFIFRCVLMLFSVRGAEGVRNCE
jgi:hypothetical protein